METRKAIKPKDIELSSGKATCRIFHSTHNSFSVVEVNSIQLSLKDTNKLVKFLAKAEKWLRGEEEVRKRNRKKIK